MGMLPGYTYPVELEGGIESRGQVWGFTQSLPYGSCLGFRVVLLAIVNEFSTPLPSPGPTCNLKRGPF